MMKEASPPPPSRLPFSPSVPTQDGSRSLTLSAPASAHLLRGFQLFVALGRFAQHAAVALLLALTGPAIAQTPGDFDPSFDGPSGTGNGRFDLPIGAGNDRAMAIARQPDGKLILAGFCSNGTDDDFCVARLNPDGSYDPTFDGPSGSGNGRFLLPIGSHHDRLAAVAVQPDGKIVLAGSCSTGGNYDFCVARIDPDGKYDLSFNGTGRRIQSIGAAQDAVSSMVLQPDGKIVLAGHCNVGMGPALDFCLARFNPDGSLDATFDGPSGTGNGFFLLPVGSNDDLSPTVLLQPDGKLVLVGACLGSGLGHEFCLARLNADGSFDTSFDGPSGTGDGRFLLTGLPFIVMTVKLSAALGPDGHIVFGGYCLAGLSFQFCLVRLDPNGDWDKTFDGPSGTGNGVVTFTITPSDNSLVDLALQPDGKIVVLGVCAGPPDLVCLARLHPDGTFDTTFDGPFPSMGDGRFALPAGPSSLVGPRALLLEPDGRIVALSECSNGSNTDFCVLRLEGGPFGFKQCSLDIDGDQQYHPTRDGLLMTRVMLGMTGTAVTQGVSFAPHATRTTWGAIRHFLVTQCGMHLPQ